MQGAALNPICTVICGQSGSTIFFTLKKVKFSRYRPGVAQRVGTCIALLFHEHGTRRGWVVSSTPRPHFTPRKDPVTILQEAGWAPGPVWTGGKPRPHRDSIPDRPARSHSLYRLSYPAHYIFYVILLDARRNKRNKLLRIKKICNFLCNICLKYLFFLL